jgi:hypothetical protein
MPTLSHIRTLVSRLRVGERVHMPFDINASNEWWKSAHIGNHATRERMVGVDDE